MFTIWLLSVYKVEYYIQIIQITIDNINDQSRLLIINIL